MAVDWGGRLLELLGCEVYLNAVGVLVRNQRNEVEIFCRFNKIIGYGLCASCSVSISCFLSNTAACFSLLSSCDCPAATSTATSSARASNPYRRFFSAKRRIWFIRAACHRAEPVIARWSLVLQAFAFDRLKQGLAAPKRHGRESCHYRVVDTLHWLAAEHATRHRSGSLGLAARQKDAFNCELSTSSRWNHHLKALLPGRTAQAAMTHHHFHIWHKQPK